MGKFTYEGSIKVEFDDRALAHLMFAIGTKLRRKEPFYFSWKDDASVGDGRTTIWVHPACSLAFKFYGSRMPNLNPVWIEALVQTASSNSGLHLVPEPSVPAATSRQSTNSPDPKQVARATVTKACSW